jgi:hypothetical protein
MSESPTPPRRRWFQFSLATMFVVVTLVAICIAAFGIWAVPIAGFVGVAIGLSAISVMLGRVADRLESHGQKVAGCATRLACLLPLLLAMVVLLATCFLYVVSQSPKSGQ